MVDSRSFRTFNSERIKILVSYHKDSVMPSSSIFLPIHVGATFASSAIPNTIRDDSGINISDRNFSFSEMSGQYWAWKNLDLSGLDYIGQCHYRRFFCFDGIEHEMNDHAQIEIMSLNQQTMNDYRLDDEILIANSLKEVDILIPKPWSVIGVPTPHGPQNTVRSHMEAYELITPEDFDLFLSIVDQRQPEYAQYVRDYVEGDEYIGYNCFIMRPEHFDQLCEFEFDILEAFDMLFDYFDRTPTQTRVCGYLGEILFSAYIKRMQEEANVNIIDAPLTFFFNTEPKRIVSTNNSQSQLRKVSESQLYHSNLISSAPLHTASDGTTVTIIVPIDILNDSAETFLQALHAQTHRQMEVLFIGNPANAKIQQLLEQFLAQDSRFNFIFDEGHDLSAHRNIGINHAHSSFLLFLDEQCIPNNTMVQQLVSRAFETNSDIALCRISTFASHDTCRTSRNSIGPIGINYDHVYEKDAITKRLFQIGQEVIWNKLFRADFIRQNNLYFNLPHSGSSLFTFMYTALLRAGRVSFVSENLCYANAENTNGNIFESTEDACATFVEVEEKLSNLPEWTEAIESEWINWMLLLSRTQYAASPPNTETHSLNFYMDILKRTANWSRHQFLYPTDWYSSYAMHCKDIDANSLVIGMNLKLDQLTKELSTAKRSSRGIENQQKQLESCMQRLSAIEKSKSYKIGHFLTAPMRAIRKCH